MPHSAELRQQIEDLALQLVTADSRNETRERWQPALCHIRDLALRDDATTVASTATGLIESLRAESGPTADLLPAGIAERKNGPTDLLPTSVR